MSTPCELLGYEVDMEFKFVTDDDSSMFSVADSLWLHKDDGTSCPEFRNTEEYDEDESETEYVELDYVVRVIDGLSPAKSRGLKVGDKVEAAEDDGGEDVEEGEVLTFSTDDGTCCPYFRKEDGTQACLYIGQVRSLQPVVGAKVRILHNCTRGHPEGTEGVIRRVEGGGESLSIFAKGSSMRHSIGSCFVFDASDVASEDKPDEGLTCKVTWKTKPADQWKKGDTGIIRGQQTRDEHNFNVGDTVTFDSHCSEGRGYFTSTNYHRSQNVDYRLIEVVEATSASDEEQLIRAKGQSETSYTYFIEGDSIAVALVGYFEGNPICAYKDRWGDIQTFVAKQSLLVSSDD